MRMIITEEKEMKCLREMIAVVFNTQEQLIPENKELREKCDMLDNKVKMNNEMKEILGEVKRENSVLKGKCENYELELQELQDKLNTSAGTAKGISKTELEEWKKVWVKEQEEKVNIAEVVKQQIREKTKDTVIQAAKEKQELVRNMVSKKKCIVKYGVEEKRTQ
ncbi:hypothetical protein E2C01_026986 [Portunus trituberculatus]|uniref:Uncharacterized protein n=1 Tax=Portunus trituberculatus TaxID=210409 RepID=A0A5B7EGZ8_PORTR|nr:hypothetical protein [Portunus trituberculatus]